MLRFHTQTAGSTLTAQQPEVNVVRTTLEALSAVLGGTQSLHTNAKDEALGLPTESAALLALRTQQVIAYESGIASTVDPLAGSFFVETLTNEIETRARQYLDRIDAAGGMLRAIESGMVQREIQESAFRHERAVESGEKIVVGVNRFTEEPASQPPVLRVSEAVGQEQITRLLRLRAERDAVRVEATLRQVEETARGTGNLMPPILAAVEADATVLSQQITFFSLASSVSMVETFLRGLRQACPASDRGCGFVALRLRTE
jgi:methylmalonyl-CoA mutase N-terminal domain/subunit